MASGAQELETFVRAHWSAVPQSRRSKKPCRKPDGRASRHGAPLFSPTSNSGSGSQTRPHLSAREAFLYLVLYTTLYLTSYYLGCLLFELIDHAFPDLAVTAYSGNHPRNESAGRLHRRCCFRSSCFSGTRTANLRASCDRACRSVVGCLFQFVLRDS